MIGFGFLTLTNVKEDAEEVENGLEEEKKVRGITIESVKN